MSKAVNIRQVVVRKDFCKKYSANNKNIITVLRQAGELVIGMSIPASLFTWLLFWSNSVKQPFNQSVKINCRTALRIIKNIQVFTAEKYRDSLI
jgi:hypothetical protein